MTLFRKSNILMQKLSQLHHYHHCYNHCTMLNCTRDCRIRKTIASISYIIETVGGKHLFLNKLLSASSETYQSITFNMYCNKGTSHAMCPDHHARMNHDPSGKRCSPSLIPIPLFTMRQVKYAETQCGYVGNPSNVTLIFNY